MPPKQPGICAAPVVDGGHTVRTYGSSNEDGSDAIQIEIALPLRYDAEQRAALIEYSAYAIGNPVARYGRLYRYPVA